jgi:hypothetical protein
MEPILHPRGRRNRRQVTAKMTSFDNDFRYSPYLIDTAAGSRVVVGTAGIVVSYGVPMRELLGAEPEPAPGKARDGERAETRETPALPGCEPRVGQDMRQG